VTAMDPVTPGLMARQWPEAPGPTPRVPESPIGRGT
jgi:hypothetical protein